MSVKLLTDNAQLRAKRAQAYHAGKYRFSPPPVYSGNWSVEAWCNWVTFDDPKPNGFLPYSETMNRKALALS